MHYDDTIFKMPILTPNLIFDLTILWIIDSIFQNYEKIEIKMEEMFNEKSNLNWK